MIVPGVTSLAATPEPFPGARTVATSLKPLREAIVQHVPLMRRQLPTIPVVPNALNPPASWIAVPVTVRLVHAFVVWPPTGISLIVSVVAEDVTTAAPMGSVGRENAWTAPSA